MRVPLLAAALLSCAPPAWAENRVDYEPYGQGVYLSYIDAPDEDAWARIPKLLVSFGDEPRPMVMDTGSTGIVVSADRIPGFADMASRPGTLTYSSSGRIMVGRWVTTPLTVYGRNGAAAVIQPIPVLAVTRIDCTPEARECRPEDNPHGVSMMGIGFGREYDGQSESTPDKNPFLNLAPMDSGPARRGYVVTRSGIHVGLTRANTRGDFRFVKLDSRPDIPGEWKGVPVCIAVNRQAPVGCGSALVDTGVTSMFLTLPAAQVAGAVTTDQAGHTILADGTTLTFTFTSAPGQAVAARYDLVAGDTSSPLAPNVIHLNTSRPEPFVNTTVRLLDGFDVLYDADGGYYAFRARSNVSAGSE